MEQITREDLSRLMGDFISVQNLWSENGNRISNQFEIHFENAIAFQSYQSLIAVKMHGDLYLTDEHDYSKTTSKYYTQWTGKNIETRRRELKKGIAIQII